MHQWSSGPDPMRPVPRTSMTSDSAECQLCPFQARPFQMRACAAESWIGYCTPALIDGNPAGAAEAAVLRFRPGHTHQNFYDYWQDHIDSRRSRSVLWCRW